MMLLRNEIFIWKTWRKLISASFNKPGTAQVGAISKVRKDSKTKTTFSTTGDNKSSQKTKNFEIFLKFPVSRIVPKNVKGRRFGIFWTSILLQNIKNWWEEQ